MGAIYNVFTDLDELILAVNANTLKAIDREMTEVEDGDPLQHLTALANAYLTYAVRNRDSFLQWHPLGGLGLIAEEAGDSQLETTFTLLDQGAAALPKPG